MDQPVHFGMAKHRSMAAPLLNPLNWAPPRGRADPLSQPDLIPVSELKGLERADACEDIDERWMRQRVRESRNVLNLMGEDARHY